MELALEKLILLLEEKNMSRRELANRINKPLSFISRVMAGHIKLNRRLITNISTALEVDESYFFPEIMEKKLDVVKRSYFPKLNFNISINIHVPLFISCALLLVP